MTLFDAQDTHQALEDLLLRERDAILSGKYDGLEKMVIEKERLLNALSRTRLEPRILEHLKEQSERNAVLFDAVRAGIGSALERLRAIHEPAAPLKTYDQSGRTTSLTVARAQNSRRA
jgi:hypothetical protein